MKVVLAEKPSVAKDLAKVLKATKRQDGFFEGNGYYVTWAFGHLVQLVHPEEYAKEFEKWNLTHLPIIPEKFLKKISENDGAKKQFKTISGLFNLEKTKEIICATDAGREGELIFRFIYEASKVKKPFSRLWISSQTDSAISEGFDNLKPGSQYDPLFYSAVSRSEADWLIGINATRAYTGKYSRGSGVMSVGRVQTPVLKLIVDRHFEHINFKPQTYYEIFAQILHKKGEYEGKWFKKGEEDRLSDQAKAEELAENIKSFNKGKIISCIRKERKEKQPLLYDLTELQKDANKKFNFSADKTLQLMQTLYERHKILTYPRTSSKYLSSDMKPKLPGLLQNLNHLPEYATFTEKILQNKLNISKRIVDDSKVTDHTAIIPTDKKAELEQLDTDERKIFDLVIRRFLAVFLDECVKDQTDIITGFSEYTFKTTGIVIKQPGWREVYMKETMVKEEKDEKNEERENNLPDVKKDDEVSQKALKLEEKQTKAPPLHNEASILAAMETAGKNIEDEELKEAMKECGLGTPATRAQILERLIEVGYVIRDKNKLIPTQKGYNLISVIQDKELLSAELTGEWEKKLNLMAQNKYERAIYMQEIKEFTKKIVKSVVNSNADILQMPHNKPVLGKCPLCEGDVIETPKAFSCANWKSSNCTFMIWKTIAGKELTEKQAQQLLIDGQTELLKGFKSKAGKKFDASLTLNKETKKIEFKFLDYSDPETQKAASIGKCPICDGLIIETPKAFSCSNWKEKGCKFVIWKFIAKKKITATMAKTLLTKGRTEKIDGFKSKAGKTFEAVLIIEKDKVSFQFGSVAK